MRTVQVVEAKAKFSSLLAAVEAGEEVAITRHGRIVARLVPDVPRMADEVFRPLWGAQDMDIEAPEDLSADPVLPLD